MSPGPAQEQVPQVICCTLQPAGETDGWRDRDRAPEQRRSEIRQSVSGVAGRGAGRASSGPRPQVFVVVLSSPWSPRPAGVAFWLLPLPVGQGKKLGKLRLVLETASVGSLSLQGRSL